MEREEGEIVVRTSHHWPHRSVETETSRLGKGKRGKGRGWRRRTWWGVEMGDR